MKANIFLFVVICLMVYPGFSSPVPADYYRNPDFVLKLDSQTWSELYLSAVSLNDAIDSGKVQLQGDSSEAAKVFDMFDRFNPTKNYTIPPLED